MKSIALRPWELAAYMRHKKLLVVRPVKPQPPSWAPDKIGVHDLDEPPGYGFFDEDGTAYRCPFGKPGEVLGIKESGQWEAAEFDHTLCGTAPVIPADIRYAADGCPKPWKPAQQMPEWAIRHRPIIADIRVMRVGEMSEEDAQATGMRSFTKDGRLHKFWFCDPVEDNPPKSLRVSWADMPRSAAEAFKELWNKHYPTLSWGWGIFLEGT